MAIAEQPQLETAADPIEVARAAGLRYVLDNGPGISRIKHGRGFSYHHPNGEKITDKETLERIQSLRIPPAWRNVWICPNPNGHIQVTGRDERNRKQYIYHPRWREVRDENKFGRMIAFGHALPRIRQRVEEDLSRPGLPREKVLAAVVRLLETTLIRVGNDEYARTNDSYGLTTMKDEHATVEGVRVEFQFRGKRGKFHAVDLKDRRLANIVKRSQELPGEELFQYLDENCQPRDVGSGDINDYLREITGEDFTAKDFRTWGATALTLLAFQEFETFKSKSEARRNIASTMRRVSERLGNTPAICRKSYVHPDIIASYVDGTLEEGLLGAVSQALEQEGEGLDAVEIAVLRLLRRRLVIAEV